MNNVTKHTTNSGKFIETYDNILGYDRRVQIMRWALMQPFNFNVSNDSILTDQASRLCCSSQLRLSKDEYVDRFGISTVDDIFSKIKDKTLSRSWINVATAQSVPRYHPDAFKKDSVTILYYVNLKWEADWDGHTIWRSEDMNHIEFVSDYTPGRICVFDSSIPHKATIPSTQAPIFRFTLNSVWE